MLLERANMEIYASKMNNYFISAKSLHYYTFFYLTELAIFVKFTV
jgi:hypothetical protein